MKRSPRLDQYKSLVGEDALARIYRAVESLAGQHVLHINTTAQGGGVAELLDSLIRVSGKKRPCRSRLRYQDEL